MSAHAIDCSMLYLMLCSFYSALCLEVLAACVSQATPEISVTCRLMSANLRLARTQAPASISLTASPVTVSQGELSLVLDYPHQSL